MDAEEIERILGTAAVTRLRDATDLAFIMARAASDQNKGESALIELIAALALSVLITPNNFADGNARTEAFCARLKALSEEALSRYLNSDAPSRH